MPSKTNARSRSSIEAAPKKDVRDGRRLAGLVPLGQDRGCRAGARSPRPPRGMPSSSTRPACGSRRQPRPGSRTRSSSGPAAAERHRVRRPVRRSPIWIGGRSTPRTPSGSVRLLEAAWTVFDRVAASAPAELRKGPRGGGRDRDKMIAHVIEAERHYAQRDRSRRAAARSRRPVGRRGAARGDARRPPPAVRRLADRRAQVAAALRRPPDRLARARSRLGDGGPDRAGVVGRLRQPNRSRNVGRLDRPGSVDQPDRRRRLADELGRRPPAGPQLADRRVAVGLRQLRAVRPSDQPVVGERRRRLARRGDERAGSGPASRRAGRGRGRRGRCPVAGRPRRPRSRTSSCRRGRGPAGRRRRRPPRPAHGPTSSSIQRS